MTTTADRRPRTIIPIYDYSVLWFSNSFVWRCPTPRILDWYNKHISANHVDVGPGSGYYLDKCTYPSSPSITLVDYNPNNLNRSAQRIARYQPVTCEASVLKPIPLSADYDSVGVNFVFHCLRASKEEKQAAFGYLRNLLRPGGVVFGSTILGLVEEHSALAKRFLRFYNEKGIFGNSADTAADYQEMLSKNFDSYDSHVLGSVFFFAGRVHTVV